MPSGFVLSFSPLGDPLCHHLEWPPHARDNRAFILGLVVEIAGSGSPPPRDVPVINPLSSNMVTAGAGTSAEPSPPVYYSSPDVFSIWARPNRHSSLTDQHQYPTLCRMMPDTNTGNSLPIPLLRSAWHCPQLGLPQAFPHPSTPLAASSCPLPKNT